ncbi:hypothetical protein PoB_005056500 [Plakobranchus ocellatus]|uniref:Uncharacterized protein n=1 Tax=Plakobranchus ocellatus TaxID=259542 RepID=A0AAV4BY23_9GAST|nr:hypothetical protein PoB_005056500 [Plakobranchus ocellatus]
MTTTIDIAGTITNTITTTTDIATTITNTITTTTDIATTITTNTTTPTTTTTSPKQKSVGSKKLLLEIQSLNLPPPCQAQMENKRSLKEEIRHETEVIVHIHSTSLKFLVIFMWRL